ncbi:MAG: hypothetical protein U5K37_06345 [Natrialbaceae archaeon]|nr:hypothetical protein [Natrialbaceae archaeon]
MKWQDHERWARKLGISSDVATFVNRVIDVSTRSDLPGEYLDMLHKQAEYLVAERGPTTGNSMLPQIIVKEAINHDAGRQKKTRGDLSAEVVQKVLQQKGDDYLRAWYLHHFLDYVWEHRTTERSLSELTTEYEREIPSSVF